MSVTPHPPAGHVVVGVDGSPAALSAVTQAALEAANRGLPLEIVSAWTLPQDGQLDTYVRQVRREAEEATEAAVAHAQALHPQVWTIARVRRGAAHEVLLASAEHASLVVVGSRGHGRMAGLLLGSVSLSVAAYTPCPLLVVRDVSRTADDLTQGLVVVGVDGADCRPAVEAAYEEAQLRNLRVCALNALPPVAPVPIGLPAPALESLAAASALRRDAVDTWLAAPRAKHPEIESQARLVREGAGHALVQASREADLVVLAAHRRTARFGTRLGRVSHTVLHHAHAPVLLVPVG
ncbi:universal stress protein (plasmid) [Embleya sp. NBC_00888]|uniref:universal stress protein n=1 Tax=Embleya sp. NBC_00888 TaxID=2975960 RepID=UPI002F918CC2|nr:universal stress protein [Embleya sp. NBC_00888]